MIRTSTSLNVNTLPKIRLSFLKQPALGKAVTGVDGTNVVFTSLEYLQKAYSGSTSITSILNLPLYTKPFMEIGMEIGIGLYVSLFSKALY